MISCSGLIRAVRRRRRTVLLVIALALVGGAIAWAPAVRAEYHLRQAKRALDARDYDQADAELTRHLEFRPASAEGHFLLARLSRRMSHLPRAREHLDACRAAGFSVDAVTLERHLLRAQDGDLGGGAESVLRRAIEDPAERFYVFEALSQGYTKTYRLSEARFCLDRMLEDEPENVYALVRRGWVLERLGLVDAARDDYRRAAALRPDNLLARRRLADNLFYVARNAAEAVDHYEAVWRESPDDTVVGVNLAQCRLQLGRADEARALLDQLVAAHPDDVAVLVERGKLAVNEDQCEQGEAWLRRALERDPSAVAACHELARCLDLRGRPAEAARYRQRFESLKAERAKLDALVARAGQAPGDAALRCEVARLLRLFGEPQEAERWLAAALRIDPRYRPAHEALAECYERRGDRELAERHKLLAQALTPP
ncbi:tetratricopeptide repeat protein [Frigoriglobus tundricola]|uniref:Uncharacterized protein n=1 Tax=Frigoriglobus tundricola TaxID=2774151 RepID=A0A6M5YHL7_9BACT|nr:tetratricopeptide repeat protein [Frigoriglobus tundricola]QJW93559.1 hypothetical protein FTUN_1066 [Frigoriglobus tundricola]